jgi:DNA-binding transcriptional ArsR family regulator
MLDQLRHDLQHRLDDLLAEAAKLRRALGALGSGERKRPATADNGSRAPRSRRRTPTAPPRGRATARRTPASTTSAQRAKSAAAAENGTTPRTASGATKRAVLAALASGNAMTASEVANATGLGRASVSTTLSKLAKTGEITKATRGYQLAGQSTTEA